MFYFLLLLLSNTEPRMYETFTGILLRPNPGFSAMPSTLTRIRIMCRSAKFLNVPTQLLTIPCPSIYQSTHAYIHNHNVHIHPQQMLIIIVHSYMHTYKHSQKHNIQIHPQQILIINSSIHTCIHTNIHTYIHKFIHSAIKFRSNDLSQWHKKSYIQCHILGSSFSDLG